MILEEKIIEIIFKKKTQNKLKISKKALIYTKNNKCEIIINI